MMYSKCFMGFPSIQNGLWASSVLLAHTHSHNPTTIYGHSQCFITRVLSFPSPSLVRMMVRKCDRLTVSHIALYRHVFQCHAVPTSTGIISAHLRGFCLWSAVTLLLMDGVFFLSAFALQPWSSIPALHIMEYVRDFLLFYGYWNW